MTNVVATAENKPACLDVNHDLIADYINPRKEGGYPVSGSSHLFVPHLGQ